jgi:hypothetical protein
MCDDWCAGRGRAEGRKEGSEGTKCQIDREHGAAKPGEIDKTLAKRDKKYSHRGEKQEANTLKQRKEQQRQRYLNTRDVEGRWERKERKAGGKF